MQQNQKSAKLVLTLPHFPCLSPGKTLSYFHQESRPFPTPQWAYILQHTKVASYPPTGLRYYPSIVLTVLIGTFKVVQRPRDEVSIDGISQKSVHPYRFGAFILSITPLRSSCGPQAQLFQGIWDLPRPGIKPASSALAGGFLTTRPPRNIPKHGECSVNMCQIVTD